MKTSIVILTFNSAESISATVAQALQLSDDVVVVDSFSSDDSVAICKSLGARVVQHAFENYSLQRNCAIDSLSLCHPWHLHLDADECMDDTLINAIRCLPEDSPEDAFLIPRYLRFLGRILASRCETRKYDQHFHLVRGNRIGRLPGCLIDDVQISLSEWTSRHNRWSDGEADELTASQNLSGPAIKPKALGNPIEQKRYWRAKYNNLPLFVRPFLLFAYRYFFRLGMLDGKEGLVFWVLQTFWFRFLIDAKLFQRQKESALPVESRRQSEAGKPADPACLPKIVNERILHELHRRS